VNFLNLFNDDPQDTGIAGVDIYKMDPDGMAIEHWDTLQLVGDAKNSARLVAPNIPRANSNGMFEERTEPGSERQDHRALESDPLEPDGRNRVWAMPLPWHEGEAG
jgi:hypothetical protein